MRASDRNSAVPKSLFSAKSGAAFGATLFRDLVQITAFERSVDN